jgi:hypothetical protein
MDIVKQIIDQRITKILQDNPELFSDKKDEERKRSQAFLLLGVAAYLDIDIAEAIQYTTDGGQDGGFDAAYIEDTQDSQINVVLFQSKYSRKLDSDSNFPANAVEKAVNTVKCVFDPNANIQLNYKSKKKVDEIRSFILDGRIPYVTFVMLNNGIAWNNDGQNYINNAFNGQEQVKFVHFSHTDIINYINRSTPINTHINFSGKAIQEDFNYKRVILGRVSVSEIYKLMDEYGDRLLEKNIRRYLGRNIINEQISSTLLSKDKKQNFFFFNNGVTMICEKFRYNGLQEKDWNVIIDKLQIINGGQTCRTIYQTLKEHPENDFSQVYILVRLYEVNDDEDIVNDITYATNNQNPVDLRDLKSNDTIQVLLETSAKELGYTYKRKRDNSGNANVIPATVAAEAVFAVWRGKPHLAKYKRSEFFDKYYDEIFKDLNAAQMIIAVVIFRYCDNYRKKVSDDTDIKAQRAFSQYFLAYMIGKRVLLSAGISVEELTHRNFAAVMQCWEDNCEKFYKEEESKLISILRQYFNNELDKIDGRTMAAIFRRFDVLIEYLK